MKYLRAVLPAILFALTSSGCSVTKMVYGSDKPLMSFIVLEAELDNDGKIKSIKAKEEAGNGSKDKHKKHLGALMSWPPEFNAAFISKSGNGCIQPATYSKNTSAGASLPAEILSAGVKSGTIAVNFSETLDKLITVTDQSTFLSIGMYGLCQLHANNALTAEQVTTLTLELFAKAATANGSNKANKPVKENKKAISIKTKKPVKENKKTVSIKAEKPKS